VRQRFVNLLLDAWVIVILSVTIFVAIFAYRLYEQGSLRLWSEDEFKSIHLGDSRSVVLAELRDAGIVCQPKSSEQVCQFSDPWHAYRISFDEHGTVSRKAVQYRTH
jgi:hypothetical protein